MKAISLILMAFILTACSGGGGGSSDDAQNDSSSDNPGSNAGNDSDSDSDNDDGEGNTAPPRGMEISVSGAQQLPSGEETEIILQVSGLPSDDALYVSIDGFSEDQISVQPLTAMIYPSNGVAILSLTVNNLNMLNSQQLELSVKTSGGQDLYATHEVSTGR